MADKTENILVEFDYNNITIVDPNKVVDINGVVKERNVKQENLVMYANLECKMLPRTKLAVGSANDDAIQTVSVASINFLNPGGKTFLDNSYTNEFTGDGALKGQGTNQVNQTKIQNPKKPDDWYVKQTVKSSGKLGTTDNGLLGMTSIRITQDLSFMPQVDIELEDIKGRALFEAGDNSPYAAFFNLPYPMFYLTIKGYYGKAIKLALMLQNFTTRYDSNDGNFKVSLKFYTYKYTVLSEISMGYLIATPHMYKSRLKVQTQQGGPSNFSNVDNEIVEKGYQKVKEMYNEYKSKGLIPDDFPELTIVQLRNNIENFVKNILDSFTKQNLDPLTNIDDFQKTLNDYERDVYTYLSGGKGSWFDQTMDRTNFLVLKNGSRVYTYKKELTDAQSRTNSKSKLKDEILSKYNELLENDKTVGKDGSYTIDKAVTKISVTNKYQITENVFYAKNVTSENVDFLETFRQVKKVKKEPETSELQAFAADLQAAGIFDKTPATSVLGFKLLPTEWFIFEGSEGTFMDLTGKMSKQLKVFREEIESKLTEALSDLLQSKDNGIGFTPNIRNVLAVIFANGEAFLRLIDEVHYKAWNVRNEKYRKEAIFDKDVSSASPETKDTGGDEDIPVYPWPQYIVSTPGEKGQEKYEIQYPGDSKFVSKTKGYLFDVWPEIEFVEEFIKGFVERTLPPADPTDGNNELTDPQRVSLNPLEYPVKNDIYSNKEEVKFIYEMYERLFTYTFYTRLSRVYGTSDTDSVAKIIAEIESNNILKSLSNDNPFLIQKIKNYGLNSANIIDVLKHISNEGVGESWQNYLRGIFNTVYLRNLTSNYLFEVVKYDNSVGTPIMSFKSEPELVTYLTGSNKSNSITFTDIYPFTDTPWVRTNLSHVNQGDTASVVFDTRNVLTLHSGKKMISNYNDAYTDDMVRPFTYFLKGTTNGLVNPLVPLSSFYDGRRGDGKEGNQFFTEGNLTYLNYSGNVSPNQTVSMLNTPYFINAIQIGVNNFRNSDPYPYKEAAYLFLNSVPLGTLRERYRTYIDSDIPQVKDLDLIFATMKKYGAIHKVPYAWILKYGSIWHRYKTYVETGVDIINTSWTNFNYINNYDPITNNPQKNYNLTINSSIVDIFLEKNTTINTVPGTDSSSIVNVGFYPQTIDDFNVFFQGFKLFSGFTSSDIQSGFSLGLEMQYVDESIIDKSSLIQPLLGATTANTRTLTVVPWSVYVKTLDNNYFYLMPSEGSVINQTENECFNATQQTIEVTGNTSVYNGSVRLFWDAPNYGYFDAGKIIKPSPSQYLKQVMSGFSLDYSFQTNFSLKGSSKDYTEIEEMFSVFEKDALDIFEQEYLNFSKSIYDTTEGDPQHNFQSLMRTICKIPKITNFNDSYDLIKQMKSSQTKILNTTINDFMNFNKIIKFGNPNSYDKKLFYTFSNLSITDPYTFGYYVISSPNSLPTSNNGVTLATSKTNYPNEWDALETYVGFSTIDKLKYDNNGSFITDFFIDNNVEFSVINIKQFAPLIKIYATQKLKDPTLNSTKFLTLMTEYLLQVDSFQDKVFDNVMITLNKNLPNVNSSPENRVPSDLQGPQTKVELWESFKSLNDKWISGNDFKVKTLFEDILMLDRASRNVGDKILVDVYKLKNRLENVLNSPKISMLTFVTTILQENNFVVMNLPSYVNFYNVQDVTKNPKPKSEGTLEFANTLFGTFLEVDYRDTGPKMVCLYGGKPSEQLDLKENVDYRYRNDAFDLRKVDNPLVENLEGKNDWDKSNKVVGFNVDIGPQNQSMFYGFMVDQRNSTSTVESLEVINQMANLNGNRGGSTSSVSLYNLYKNRSYTCTLSMMGNALIQPTMYFNLRYVPMFSGPYMILSVNHSIQAGQFETTITGVRQPVASLPKIENYIQTLKNNLLKNIIENNKKDRGAKNKDNKNADGTTQSKQTKIQAITGGDKELSTSQTCKPLSPYDTFYSITPKSYSKSYTNTKGEILETINIGGFNTDKLKFIIFAALYVESADGDSKITAYENNFAGVTLTGPWGPSQRYFNGNKSFFCQSSSNDSTTLPYAVFDDIKNLITFIANRWNGRMTTDIAVTPESITKFLILNNLTIDGNKIKSVDVYNSYDPTKLKNLEAKVKKSIDVFNATN